MNDNEWNKVIWNLANEANISNKSEFDYSL